MKLKMPATPWPILASIAGACVLLILSLAALDWFKGLMPETAPGRSPMRRVVPVVAPMSPLVTGRKRTLFHKAAPPVAEKVEALPVATLTPTPAEEKAIEKAGFTPPAEGSKLLGIWPVPPPGFHVKRSAGQAMVRLDPPEEPGGAARPVFTFVEDQPSFFEWGGAWEAAAGPMAETEGGYGVTARVGKDFFRTGRLYWHGELAGDLTSGKVRGRAALLFVMRGGE